MDIETLKNTLDSNLIDLPNLDNAPTLNQQNKKKIKVLLALMTEIVARESKCADYMLNKPDIEVIHFKSLLYNVLYHFNNIIVKRSWQINNLENKSAKE